MLVNNNIGSLYMELGLYEKAIRYFNEALELCKLPLHGERIAIIRSFSCFI